jgi:hypothetical protein
MTDERITRVLQLELAVLRTICSNTVAGASRETIMRQLSVHSWKSAEHRIVFEAIARLGGRPAKHLREELPAQATRMGFPDVDWAAYFTSGDEEQVDLEALVQELTLLARQDAQSNQT